MGTVAPNKDDDGDGRAPSESSGLSDIMEIAASLGIEESEAEGAHSDEAEDDDDLHNLSAGYGGTAAAALVADATVEPPPPVKAANAPKSDPKIPIAAPVVEAAKPPPPPPPKSAASSAAMSKPLTVAPPLASASSTAMPAAAASTSAARIAVPIPLAQALEPGRPRTAKRGGGGWVLATSAILALGIVGFFLLNRDAGPSADTQVAAAEVVAPEPEPEPEPEPPKPAPVVVAPAPVPEPVVEPVVEEPPAAPEPVEVGATVTKRKGKKGAAEGDKAVAEEEEKDSPFEDKTDDGKFSAECLLDPSKPGCEELLRKRRGKGTNLDATLSDKLTQTQIRAGFASVKGKAKGCGGEPGSTVRVKVSISGDGDVISAEALSPNDSDAVGQCVADALKGAKFDRFTSSQMGTIYPVSF